MTAITGRVDVPPRLIAGTVVAASRLAAGGKLAVTVPMVVATLMKPSPRSTMMIATFGTGLVALGIAILSNGIGQSPRGGDEPARSVRSGADQPDPSVLSLFGVTDYDPACVTTVRVPFDSRVDKVLVDLGTTVFKDDPLLELFSTDLAAAKSDYELAISQYNHDKNVYNYKKPLAENNTLPRKELIEIENDLAQSQLKMKVAKDKLLVYGLTEQEIQAAKKEDGNQKARITLRSRGAGIVVKRNVVQGNFYDSKDTLLTIAVLDHLWVRGNASEREADKLEVGQTLEVIFPFSSTNREISEKLEWIDRMIDPDTRKAKFRTTIPNPQGKYKAGAYVAVKVHLKPMKDVPPGRGHSGPSRRAEGEGRRARDE